MKISYEAKEGIVQVGLFVPGAALVMVPVMALMLLLMVAEAYHSAPWLHGAVFDLDTMLFRSDTFRIAPPGGVEPDGAAIQALLADLQTPRVVFVVTWVQNLALVGLCAVLAAGAARVRRRLQGSGPTVGQALRDTFAARATSPATAGVALFAGLSVLWLPAALMQVVLRSVDLDNTTGELIVRTLVDAGPLVLAIGVFTMVVAVPIAEELVFRGFLWRAGERWMHPALLWVLTSLVFAANHMSPAHVLGVTLHGFLFGWLRLTSGSVVPPILAHVANNGLAVGLVLAAGGDDEPSSALVLVGMAAYGAVAVAASAWGAWRLRARPGRDTGALGSG